MSRRLEQPFVDIRPEVREAEERGATPVSATVSVTIWSRRIVEWVKRSYSLCVLRRFGRYLRSVGVALSKVSSFSPVTNWFSIFSSVSTETPIVPVISYYSPIITIVP